MWTRLYEETNQKQITWSERQTNAYWIEWSSVSDWASARELIVRTQGGNGVSGWPGIVYFLLGQCGWWGWEYNNSAHAWGGTMMSYFTFYPCRRWIREALLPTIPIPDGPSLFYSPSTHGIDKWFPLFALLSNLYSVAKLSKSFLQLVKNHFRDTYHNQSQHSELCDHHL